MKYNKTYKIKYFRRKYLKSSKSRGCGNISPQILKNININKRKRKGKYKKVTYLLFTLYLNKWWISG